MTSKLVAALCLTAFLAAQATAQQGPQGRGPGAVIERLNLSDEQQKQFDALASDFRKGMVDQHAGIAKARLELVDLLKGDNPNRAKIADQLAKVSALESAAKLKALDHWFAVNKILTPEQQKEWKDGLGRVIEDRMAARAQRGPRQGCSCRAEGRGMQGHPR